MTAVHATATLQPMCHWAVLRIKRGADARNIIQQFDGTDDVIRWTRPLTRDGKGVRAGNERHDLLKWLISTLFNIPSHVLEELKISDVQREEMLKPFVIIVSVTSDPMDQPEDRIVITGRGLRVTR